MRARCRWPSPVEPRRVVLQRALQLRTRRLPRRHDAEQQAGDDREHHRERQRLAVDADRRDARHLAGIEREDQVDAPERQQHAERRRRPARSPRFRSAAAASASSDRRQSPRESPARARARWRAPSAGWRRWRRRSAARSRPRRAAPAAACAPIRPADPAAACATPMKFDESSGYCLRQLIGDRRQLGVGLLRPTTPSFRRAMPRRQCAPRCSRGSASGPPQLGTS